MTNVPYNGITYGVPATGEENWGGSTKVDGLLIALATYSLSQDGGLFSLSNDLDFGPSAGLKSIYYKSRGTVASTGILRMATTEAIAWRNALDSGNNTLATDSSDRLLYNGVILASASGVVPVASGGTNITSYTAGDLIYASGATTLAKLGIGTANKVLTSNGSVPGWALLVDANLDAAAAVARSKIAAGTADHVLINSGAGALSSEAALSPVRGGTGVANNAACTTTRSGNFAMTITLTNTTSVTFPTSGTLATLAGTENLSNKTFTDAPTMAAAITIAQVATPSNPASGYNKLYTKSGSSLNWLDSGGLEHQAIDVQSGPYDLRNFIINGNMDFWQRGTSFATIANGTYTADRWSYYKATTGAVHTVQRSTDIPTLSQSGFQSSYSLHADCTTADASVAAGDTAGLLYKMEGYEWAKLRGLQVTLNFWWKSTKTGTQCVAFRNNGNDRSYVAEFTISTTDTWEEKTITLTLNPSSGTDDYTNGVGLSIAFPLICGSTFQTTANAWQTGNFTGTSNQVNHCDDTANDVRIAQVQLIVGSVAGNFVRAGGNPSGELMLCQRYYEKTYEVDTAPGTATSVGKLGFACYVNGVNVATSLPLIVRKRAVPTYNFYSPSTGTAGKYRDEVAATDRNMTGNFNAGQYSPGELDIAGGVAANYGFYHFTADAEL